MGSGFVSSLFRPRKARLTEQFVRDHAIAGRTLPLTIRPNMQARRLTLRIDASGQALRLSAPHGTPLADVDAFLARHSGWLEARLARIPEAGALRPGASIPVRGVKHRIVATGALRGVPEVRQGAEGPELGVPGEVDHCGRRVGDFLKKIAKAEIEPLVARHAAAVGRKPVAVRFKDTRSRWGSCTSDGALSFNWRIAMAPTVVLDYLVAHGVAHLVEMNHGPKFWALCRTLCPRTDEARAWLKRNGGKLQAIRFDC